MTGKPCFHTEDVNDVGGFVSVGCSELDFNTAMFEIGAHSFPFLDTVRIPFVTMSMPLE